jgi:hypothetical protein
VAGDVSKVASQLILGVGTAAAVCAFGVTATVWAGAAGVGSTLPWILGRGLGIAGYLSLFALTSVGLWLGHPWRHRHPWPRPEAVLRVHVALSALTLVVVVGHILALALDPWAGVGWLGTAVPGASAYRPVAVALGSLGVYAGLLVGMSAALAGRLRRVPWLPVHRLAFATLALVWLHGILAGSDTRVLLPIYVTTGVITTLLWLTRRLVRPATPAAPSRDRPSIAVGRR